MFCLGFPQPKFPATSQLNSLAYCSIPRSMLLALPWLPLPPPRASVPTIQSSTIQPSTSLCLSRGSWAYKRRSRQRCFPPVTSAISSAPPITPPATQTQPSFGTIWWGLVISSWVCLLSVLSSSLKFVSNPACTLTLSHLCFPDTTFLELFCNLNFL